MSSVVTTDPAGPGRTRITSRALNRVVSAVAAEELGVDSGNVGVDLEDHGGTLTMMVRAPIHVPSLERVLGDSRIVARAGGSVLERAAAAQENIRIRVQKLTGSEVSRVVLRLTSADIRREKRVT